MTSKSEIDHNPCVPKRRVCGWDADAGRCVCLGGRTVDLLRGGRTVDLLRDGRDVGPLGGRYVGPLDGLYIGSCPSGSNVGSNESVLEYAIVRFSSLNPILIFLCHLV